MSERSIGDQFQGTTAHDMALAYRACAGAPESIQPGAVVVLVEQLDECIKDLIISAINIEREIARGTTAARRWRGVPDILRERANKARAAMELYYGTEGSKSE